MLFSESGDGEDYVGGKIQFKRTAANSQGDLSFWTRGSSGDATTVGVERMTILNAGNVGIGTNNPADPLHIYSSGDTSTGTRCENDDTTGIFYVSSAGYVCVKALTDSNIEFFVNNTKRSMFCNAKYETIGFMVSRGASKGLHFEFKYLQLSQK